MFGYLMWKEEVPCVLTSRKDKGRHSDIQKKSENEMSVE